MDMFSLSLSRDEACRTFGFTRTRLDALIAGGQLLCHVADGEIRIPIDQLEAFFRDGLLRVYRAQAMGETVVAEFDQTIAAPAPVVAPEPKAAPKASSPPESSPEKIRADIAGNDGEDADALELRISPRFIPRRQIHGIIDDVRFTIVQISHTGLRIRHTDEILPNADSKLTFALLNPARSFVMRGRLAWTSAATTESGERQYFISGVKITEHVERLVNAIEILKASHELQPDRRAAVRPANGDDGLPINAATDEEIAMVMKAVQHFAADPLDASRWYARGRFALAEAQVRRDAPRKPREREEVLGIWEFLERRVEMTKVSDILSWVRRNRGASAPVGM